MQLADFEVIFGRLLRLGMIEAQTWRDTSQPSAEAILEINLLAVGERSAAVVFRDVPEDGGDLDGLHEKEGVLVSSVEIFSAERPHIGVFGIDCSWSSMTGSYLIVSGLPKVSHGVRFREITYSQPRSTISASSILPQPSVNQAHDGDPVDVQERH